MLGQHQGSRLLQTFGVERPSLWYGAVVICRAPFVPIWLIVSGRTLLLHIVLESTGRLKGWKSDIDGRVRERRRE
jgi:hypothetical protein